MVEPRNIDEEIDLVESTAKEAGVFKVAGEEDEEHHDRSWKHVWSDDEDDEDGIEDTMPPFKVYLLNNY